jgi:hypothetical protein
MTDDILDHLFHGCALAAYVEIWQQSGQFPPDSEATRRLAYRYYEEELAAKNKRKMAEQAMERLDDRNGVRYLGSRAEKEAGT